MAKTTLCGLTADEILENIAASGYSGKHSLLIASYLYKKRLTSFSEMSGIPKLLMKYLEINAITGFLPPVVSQVSSDGTIKYLFRTENDKAFETVFIPDGKRNTVCVSTQSGCRMGCSFCATARCGFSGNLTAGEIINQIISIPGTSELTHVVFMGMGEPLDNIENVLKACEILTAEWGLSISPRNITVSTVGITPGVLKFLENTSCNLTLSLHSPFSEERRMIVPAEKKYPFTEIVDLLRNFPLKKNRRLSIAYVMKRDVNDTDDHLRALKDLLAGSQIRVNLLPYHKLPDDVHVSSSAERMQYFKHNLVISGISASVRKSRGEDISAACGLLATGLKTVDQPFASV